MKTFLLTFLDCGSGVQLELTNASVATLRSVEILTIFLKDEVTPGAPSQAHIRFEPVVSFSPKENLVIPHKTWINGRPAEQSRDQMARLRTIPGKVPPYVLDISWEDPQGKTCFQRIPVGQ
jgi:hypothetical protein